MLTAVKERVDSEAMLDLVKAIEVSFAFFSGDVPTAITTCLGMCESKVAPPAMAFAAISASWALALAGRFSECHRIADAGLRAAASGGAGPQRFVIALAEVMALTAAGDLSAADRVRERHLVLDAGVPQAEAIGKIGKLFGARSIANPVGGKGRHRTKPVDHRRKDGSACRSHQFGLSMLLVNGSMP